MKNVNVYCIILVLSILVSAVYADTFITANPGGDDYSFDIDFVTIGDVDNVSNGAGLGAVAYEYRIGKTEVTLGQRQAYEYAISGTTVNLTSNKPWGGTAIFAFLYSNWLNAGCQSAGGGLLNGGVYNFISWSAVAPWPEEFQWSNGDGTKNIWRHKDAKYFLPTEDELVKAGYYKGGSTDAGYWTYPTSSDIAPIAEGPSDGNNSANFGGGEQGVAVDVGSYPNTQSPYGLFDVAGNVWEFTEVAGTAASYWVPAWGSSYVHAVSWTAGKLDFPFAVFVGDDAGFRVASIVPVTSFLPSDFNQDGVVDAQDIRIFAGQWGSLAGGTEPLQADLNNDGIVNMLDFAVLSVEWLMQE